MSGTSETNHLERIRDVFNVYKLLMPTTSDSKPDLSLVIKHLTEIFYNKPKEPGNLGYESKALGTIKTAFEAYNLLIKWDPDEATKIIIQRLTLALTPTETAPQQNPEIDQVSNNSEKIVASNNEEAPKTPTIANAPESLPASLPSRFTTQLEKSVPSSSQGQTRKLQLALVDKSAAVSSPDQTRRSTMPVKVKGINHSSSNSLKKPIFKRTLQVPKINSSGYLKRRLKLSHKLVQLNKVRSSTVQTGTVSLNNDASGTRTEVAMTTDVERNGGGLETTNFFPSAFGSVNSSNGPAVQRHEIRKRFSAATNGETSSGTTNRTRAQGRRETSSDSQGQSEVGILGKRHGASTGKQRGRPVSSGNRKVACPYCNKMQSSHYLPVHIRIHTGEKPYSCEHCHTKFAREDALAIHLKSSGRPYKCRLCCQSYNVEALRNRHELSHRSSAIELSNNSQDNSSYTFAITNEERSTSISSGSLVKSPTASPPENYLMWTERLAVETQVEAGSSSSYQMLIAESNDNDYDEEDYMDSDFSVKDDESDDPDWSLQDAPSKKSRKRNGLRPAIAEICEICGSVFLNRNLLKSHMRKEHADPLDRPFTCKICGERFKHYTNCQRHEKFQHKNVVLKQCPECPRQFFDSDDLLRHYQAEHSNQPFCI